MQSSCHLKTHIHVICSMKTTQYSRLYITMHAYTSQRFHFSLLQLPFFLVSLWSLSLSEENGWEDRHCRTAQGTHLLLERTGQLTPINIFVHHFIALLIFILLSSLQILVFFKCFFWRIYVWRKNKAEISDNLSFSEYRDHFFLPLSFISYLDHRVILYGWSTFLVLVNVNISTFDNKQNLIK